MKVWVLTSEYNDYDQYGEYFEKVFKAKPTSDELIAAGVDESAVSHVLGAGGGRIEVEDKWWHLHEVVL